MFKIMWYASKNFDNFGDMIQTALDITHREVEDVEWLTNVHDNQGWDIQVEFVQL